MDKSGEGYELGFGGDWGGVGEGGGGGLEGGLLIYFLVN